MYMLQLASTSAIGQESRVAVPWVTDLQTREASATHSGTEGNYEAPVRATCSRILQARAIAARRKSRSVTEPSHWLDTLEGTGPRRSRAQARPNQESGQAPANHSPWTWLWI